MAQLQKAKVVHETIAFDPLCGLPPSKRVNQTGHQPREM